MTIHEIRMSELVAAQTNAARAVADCEVEIIKIQVQIRSVEPDQLIRLSVGLAAMLAEAAGATRFLAFLSADEELLKGSELFLRSIRDYVAARACFDRAENMLGEAAEGLPDTMDFWTNAKWLEDRVNRTQEDLGALSKLVSEQANRIDDRIQKEVPPVAIRTNPRHRRQVLVSFRGVTRALPKKIADFLVQLGQGELAWIDYREVDGHGENDGRPGLREIHPLLSIEVLRDRTMKKKGYKARYSAPGLEGKVQDLRERESSRADSFGLLTGDSEETVSI